jgi:amino acid transporter
MTNKVADPSKFIFARDVIVHVSTLSSAIFAVTIAFAHDFPLGHGARPAMLIAAWCCLVVVIFTGIFALLKLMWKDQSDAMTLYQGKFPWIWGIQQIAFLAAVVLFLVLGCMSI